MQNIFFFQFDPKKKNSSASSSQCTLDLHDWRLDYRDIYRVILLGDGVETVTWF